MRIIISPAKKMKVDVDSLEPTAQPALLDKSRQLANWMRDLPFARQKELWECSDAIARESARQFAEMNLAAAATAALLAYDGIQYTYMAPAVFEDGQLAYVQDHLRILSGFYGVLRPMDAVVPYRLELKTKGAPSPARNLYEFWGSDIYEAVMSGNADRTVVNLASKEYSRAVERWLRPGDRFVTCVFSQLEGQRVMQKGVYAKMARGEMVRYMASVGAAEPEVMRAFDWSGYRFDPERSTDDTYVFVKG